MAMKKSLIDLQAADGLQQKIDVHRLPLGKAAAAVNLVKNKMGRLEKRLGLGKLSGTDPFGSGFFITQGVALGSWNGEAGADNLLIIGRGSWFNQTTTTLQCYSDDLGGPTLRALLPEFSVQTDRAIAGGQGTVGSPQSALIDNFLVTVWIETSAAPVQPAYGQLTWSCLDVSTGEVVVGPTSIDAGTTGTECQFFRVFLVASTFVICYTSLTGVDKTVYACKLTDASLKAGGVFSVGAAITNITTNKAGPSGTSRAFDAQSVSGDTANFAVAWLDPDGVVLSKVALSTLIGSTPLVVGPGVSAAQAFAVRADVASNNAVVAWCDNSALPTNPYTVSAAGALWAGMAVAYTAALLYTGADKYEAPPTWLDLAYVGNTVSTAPNYVCSHSPSGAVWNAAFTYGGQWYNQGAKMVGLLQTQQDRLVTDDGNSGGAGYFFPSNNARIIQNQFFLNSGSGAVNPVVAMSGGTATGGSAPNCVVTPGLILASRSMEVNGRAYYLGWIPSLTQGGFVILAYDVAVGIVSPASGNGWPMRPCGNLQTRTALSDPGFGLQPNNNPPATFVLPTPVGPNCWTGGSSWCQSGDQFGTVYVSYVSSAQGQRLQPAYAAIQTTPWSGYQTAQWGTLTAISGAIPTVFDGQNAVEQSYLWAPESIIAQVSVPSAKTNNGLTWTNSPHTSFSWIFTWEYFDAQGNFHIGARSTPVTIADGDIASAIPAYTFTNPAIVEFTIPTLGATLRMNPFGMTTATSSDLRNYMPLPAGPITLGVYRTGRSDGPFAETYFRVNDRFFNGNDTAMISGSTANFIPPLVNNQFASTYTPAVSGQICTINFNDSIPDSELTTGNLTGHVAHPLLYGDGTNGSPGALDNFCPSASQIMVRHKERLFTARDNLILFTKSRGEGSGPGYDEQVNAIFVGGDDPILGVESMDDKLVVFKADQLYYIAGDGPADDGSGSSFGVPQPIPTDVGCNGPQSIRSTPEGVYFMSTAGLRRVSRNLTVEYVGGPVEDELANLPNVVAAVLYPQENRYLMFANAAAFPYPVQFAGEIIVRDYVLDAWTTSVVSQAGEDGVQTLGFVSAAIANAVGGPSLPPLSPYAKPTLHCLDATGVVWRERFPLDATAYYDDVTYVSSTWTTGTIRAPNDQGRFRLWDIQFLGNSIDPHGLLISVAIDNGTFSSPDTWAWNTANTPSIQPGGVAQTPLTQVRTYDGRLGESFQIQVQDVVDTHSSTGEGVQMLGLTLSIGVYEGPYKLPGGSTQ